MRSGALEIGDLDRRRPLNLEKEICLGTLGFHQTHVEVPSNRSTALMVFSGRQEPALMDKKPWTCTPEQKK